MRGSFLNDLLAGPGTGEPLLFDLSTNTYSDSKSGEKYYMVENVPRIIVENKKDIKKSEIHSRYNTSFNYIDHYQKDAGFFDYSRTDIPAITGNELRRLHESIISEIDGDMSIILDAGCGNGWVSKKLIPLGKKVISMDISTENPVKAVRELNHENHAGLIADVYNLPLKNNCLDCIVAAEIMEHVPDPKLLIEELVRLLRPGGRLVITVPYDEKTEYSLCVHCNRPTPHHAHLNSFNEQNIRRYIPEKDVTLKVVRCNSKYLIISRSHIILKFLPYRSWKLIDNFFIKAFQKPTRLKIVINKL